MSFFFSAWCIDGYYYILGRSFVPGRHGQQPCKTCLSTSSIIAVSLVLPAHEFPVLTEILFESEVWQRSKPLLANYLKRRGTGLAALRPYLQIMKRKPRGWKQTYRSCSSGGGAIDCFLGYHPTWFADNLQLEVIPAFYIRKPDALWGTLGTTDLNLKFFSIPLPSQTFHHLTSFSNIFACFKSKWREAVKMTVSTASCVFIWTEN